ncbi:24943_t:CDS:2, partial [Racocetra persica]
LECPELCTAESLLGKFPVWSKKLDVHNQGRVMRHVPVNHHSMQNNPASAVVRPQSKLGFFMH